MTLHTRLRTEISRCLATGSFIRHASVLWCVNTYSGACFERIRSATNAFTLTVDVDH